MHRMITKYVCFDILTEWKEESSGFSCCAAVSIRISYIVSRVVVLASNLKKGKSRGWVRLSGATGSVSSGNSSAFNVIGSEVREIVGC